MASKQLNVKKINKMKTSSQKLNVSALEDIQNSYEQRFNCIICLCPKFKMIYGYCQHRICEDCLYNEDNIRRPSMDKCPTCQKEEAFPLIRPDIPEDSVEIQKCLGVRSCSNEGCKVELWEWEMEEHLSVCPNRSEAISTPQRTTPVRTCRNHGTKTHPQKGHLSGKLVRTRSSYNIIQLRSGRRRDTLG